MVTMVDNHVPAERAILVGIKRQTDSLEDVKDSLDELAALVDTAGAKVINTFVQARQNPDKAFFIGTGKVAELKQEAELENIDTIIFDTELSPAQIKNLEREIGKKILDRSWVILDIFAARAQTRESKTQVELAQLKYFMPRLTRQWTHLSRQVGGGVGTKGPGETQLETDKRLIRDRISILEDELKEIEKQRNIRRRSRQNNFKVILAGYTNVGKSTLMNRLSNAGVLVENRLFATLDSTTRTIDLKDKKKFLLSDTVGFISKLPHNLVASFKSTLEEVLDADLILHVVDVSHRNHLEQMKTVEKVLKDLGAEDKKVLYVFNKADSLSEDELEVLVDTKYKDNSVFISAYTGMNIEILLDKILEIMESDFVTQEVICTLRESKFIAMIHQMTEVLEEEYFEDKVRIVFKTSSSSLNYLNSLRY
jgi:GTP-binding protein HflX